MRPLDLRKSSTGGWQAGDRIKGRVVSLGVTDAVNLDGGGSATLVHAASAEPPLQLS